MARDRFLTAIRRLISESQNFFLVRLKFNSSDLVFAVGRAVQYLYRVELFPELREVQSGVIIIGGALVKRRVEDSGIYQIGAGEATLGAPNTF